MWKLPSGSSSRTPEAASICTKRRRYGMCRGSRDWTTHVRVEPVGGKVYVGYGHVATRKPAALLIFDTETGMRTAELDIAGDADDLFYDAKRKRLYVIGGEGSIDIVDQKDADHYERAAQVRTVRGAHTGLFVPSRDALYVAVPAHAGGPAEIRAFTPR
jgi:hypothetical protein